MKKIITKNLLYLNLMNQKLMFYILMVNFRVKEKENLQEFKYNLDTETLSKHLYLHLCRYSPLKELLKSVSINEDVFKHEFKVALNDFLKLNT